MLFLMLDKVWIRVKLGYVDTKDFKYIGYQNAHSITCTVEDSNVKTRGCVENNEVLKVANKDAIFRTFYFRTRAS